MSVIAGSEAVWHEVENGAYAADLELWRMLSREAAGPVLDLGAGTGRVTLHLARAGIEVTALDRSPELLAELKRRATAEGLLVSTEHADAREFALDRRFAAILAPMQLVHLLGGPDGRRRMLGSAVQQLEPGGALAVALLSRPELPPIGGAPILPDVREVEGWVHSSQPLDVREVEGGLELLRLRQLVSPGGELSEQVSTIVLDLIDAEGFESEAAELGLIARERLEIAPTADHVGSVVCVLEADR